MSTETVGLVELTTDIILIAEHEMDCAMSVEGMRKLKETIREHLEQRVRSLREKIAAVDLSDILSAFIDEYERKTFEDYAQKRNTCEKAILERLQGEIESIIGK